MTTPWEPEIVVSKELASKLINAQFPSIQIESIQEIGKGFDNTIFLVNHQYTFRFPRREVAVELLYNEWMILKKLSQNPLPIPIPEPLFWGRESKSYPWIFVGYNYIEGKTPVSLNKQNRSTMIAPLAVFLKTLHQYPVEDLQKKGFPYDTIDRLHIGKRKERLLKNIQHLQQVECCSLYKVVEDYARCLQHIEIPTLHYVTHGDLHIRNILINESKELVGIIDWGDTHIGHPAVDLSIVYSLIPEEEREQFFKLYGKVEDTTLYLAKFKAIYTLIYLLVYSRDINDLSTYKFAKSCLENALV